MIFSINKDREKYRLRKTRIKILESVLYYRSSLCIPKGVLCKARDHKFVCLHKPLPAPGFMWLITCLVRSGQCPHLIPALYGTGFARSIFRAGASRPYPRSCVCAPVVTHPLQAAGTFLQMGMEINFIEISPFVI